MILYDDHFLLWRASAMTIESGTPTYLNLTGHTPTQQRWNRAVKKAKVLGKSLDDELNATMLIERYWPETFPLHYRGKEVHLYINAYSNLFELWRNDPHAPPEFEKYLLKQIENMTPTQVDWLERHFVTYFSIDECAQFETKFTPQQTFVGGQPVEDGEYLCTLVGFRNEYNEIEKKWYMHPKVRGVIQHSSFSRGGPVISAHLGAIRDGKLVRVLMYSGHYHPQKKEKEQVINYLTEQLDEECLQDVIVEDYSETWMTALYKIQSLVLKNFGLKARYDITWIPLLNRLF